MRLVYMGAYGEIKPGSLMEQLAIQGLKDIQNEEVLKTKLLVYGSYQVESDELRKAFKAYSAAASPFTQAAIAKRDKKRKQELDEEVGRGSFQITPLHAPDEDAVKARSGERKSRKLRLKKTKH